MEFRKLLCYTFLFIAFFYGGNAYATESLDVVTHLNSEDFLTQDPSTYFFDLGLFAGFILILLLYSFLIFINVKQPLFLWFFVYTLLVSLYLGLTERWIVFFNEEWLEYFNVLNSVFILYAFKSFFQRVLNTQVYFKVQNRWMDNLFLIALGFVLFQIFLPDSWILIVFTRVLFLSIIALVFYCIHNNPELTRVQFQLLQISIISLILAGLSMTLKNLSFQFPFNLVLLGVLFFVLHILSYSMAVLYRIKKLSDKNESLWKEIRQSKTALLEAHFAGVEEEKLRIMNELQTEVIAQMDAVLATNAINNLDYKPILYTLRDDTLLISKALDASRLQIDSNSFIQQLKNLLASYESEETQFKLIYFNEEIALNLHQQDHLIKISQEALNNIEKYALASKVEVQALQNDRNFILSIEDNGIGFNPKGKMNGIGILNMKNRVLEMKGTFNISSTKGKGASIIITVETN